MRIHFAVAFVVLVAALIVNVTKLELIALLHLDHVRADRRDDQHRRSRRAIDIATTSFDPMAKLAKDIAAGAVLIATVERGRRRLPRLRRQGRRPLVATLLDRLRDAPAELTLVALVLTVIVVIATKAYTGRGTPLRGGLPSGHAALAFAGWMAATYVAGDGHRFLISSIALIMALLVAQTRVESGVHSALEVTLRRARRRARDARRLPGVLVSDELVEQGGGGGDAGVRAVLELPRRRRRAHERRPRVRGRERRERRLPARRLRREDGDRARPPPPGYRPGDIAAIGITASPCGGCRQWLHEWRIAEVSLPARATARSRTATGRRPAARHLGPARMKSGFVAVAGRPNVGKSTLVNALTGTKVAIVSDKPHTTRHRIRGVHTTDDAQLVLVDLPGLAEADRHADRADAGDASTRRWPTTSTWCCSSSTRASGSARATATSRGSVFELGVPVVIVVNKIDRLKPGHIATQMKAAVDARRLPRAASGEREDGRRDRRAARRPDLAAPGGADVLPRGHRHRHAARGAHRRARARAGAAADEGGGAARGHRRGGGDRREARARPPLHRDREPEADPDRQGRHDGARDRPRPRARTSSSSSATRSTSSCR